MGRAARVPWLQAVVRAHHAGIQALLCLGAAVVPGDALCRGGTGAVSYTHLDVYKRQG